MSLNKVMLIGRVGKNPETKQTENSGVCKFSLATSEKWTDKNSGQKQEKTDWHNIVVWGKLADICQQYLSKGSHCYIEGKISNRSWDDKDGNKKYITEIVASNVIFLSISNNEKDENEKQNTPTSKNTGEIMTSKDYAHDDIPF